MSATPIPSIALIGYGEAGHTFAHAAGWEAQACAFDPLPARHAVMDADGVIVRASPAQALERADLVLSLVTADSALDAAQAAAPLLKPGALFCDMNSVSPDTKRAGAAAVHAGAGRYVDVAVLAPVHPARLRVPLLIAGPAASDGRDALEQVGFANTRIVGDDIGRASAIKMIRSIMVKGVEALTAEMMIAATRAGVTEEVIASLDASEKNIGWAERAEYNLERMMTHGLRRAAEMEESAKTLTGLGIEPLMTGGTVQRQRAMAGRTPEDFSQ